MVIQKRKAVFKDRESHNLGKATLIYIVDIGIPPHDQLVIRRQQKTGRARIARTHIFLI